MNSTLFETLLNNSPQHNALREWMTADHTVVTVDGEGDVLIHDDKLNATFTLFTIGRSVYWIEV